MRAAVLLVLTTALSASACKKDGGADGPAELPQIVERPIEGTNLIQQEVDLNRDGKPDIWNIYEVRDDDVRIHKQKKVDLDRDGRIDVISYFDERGSMYLEQSDTDYDGVIDRNDHYKDGVRVLSEADLNFDGRADVFRYYASSAEGKSYLDRLEADTNGDGMIDLWERFDPTGTLLRSGRDIDGDGKMDVRTD